MKTVNTLVKDIYALVKTKRVDKAVDAEAEIEKFGEAVKDLMDMLNKPVAMGLVQLDD